jgi:hypothetical protein
MIDCLTVNGLRQEGLRVEIIFVKTHISIQFVSESTNKAPRHPSYQMNHTLPFGHLVS